MIGIDVAGPLTRTKDGNLYIIAATCYFSKYAITKATKDFTAYTTAKFIFEDIICKYGHVEIILTDQGRNFEADLIRELCKLLGVEKLRTTSYHPKAAGEIERFNKSIKTMIACYVNQFHDDWDQHSNPTYFCLQHQRKRVDYVFLHTKSSLAETKQQFSTSNKKPIATSSQIHT
jgi:hypothetical protein